MPDILDDLRWRGLIAYSTDLDALRSAMAAGPVTCYGGFDPTAPSLHLGHLVLVLTLRRLQQAGHRPIALVGGATGLIGDPSGKSSERVLNDADVVAGWTDRLRAQIEPYLRFEGPDGALLVNNLEWTAELTAIDFLRDVGRHFRVNRMLTKESVSARLQSEQGISFTEFSYQILQGNDFLQLHRRHGCTLQIGGSDQWGNLTAGLDLVHRVTGASVHALATPLITKADGTKFGKTEGGALWLDPNMTSPYAFYQFWLNTEDRDVGGYLKTFSFRSPQEIEELIRQAEEQPAARAAQRALAEELTTLVHGSEECARVVAASRALFGQGELTGLEERTLDAAFAELPVTIVGGADGGLPTIAELFARTGLSPSRSAARRTVSEGGAYLNNVRVTEAEQAPGPGDLLPGGWLLLRRGRRRLAGVRVED